MTQYTDTIAETVNASPALTVALPIVSSEPTTIAPTLTSSYGGIIVDGMTLTFDELELQRSYAVVATDSLTATATLLGSIGPVLIDGVQVTDTDLPTTTYSLSMVQTVSSRDTALAAYTVIATDGAVVSDDPDVAAAIYVADSLGLGVTVQPSAVYGRTFADGLVLTDALRRFLAGDVIDAVDMTTTVVPNFRYAPALVEAVDVSESMSSSLILRAVLTENATITDEELVNAVFTATVLEDVELVAGYVSPDGTFTTWAVNTVTGATTEYDNFEFNSFAPMGQRYLAANSSGLYALDGDTDDGTDIIARIKSGLLQLTGARFTSFRGAYVATRTDEEGASQFFLKLVTGDGAERTYTVNVRDQETTKVHLGRGLRARYMSFELISTGQDFDLDSLEFVPVVSSRRV